jgi:amino acid transporter/mannitol/fructose-specific phosphotransferase system IIA component (Ntr-type)
MPAPSHQKLPKSLGLFDVYAISTGAMFSSGFFLLPGIAAAITGPSVVIAYLIASILMVPALLSMAELSTAMPRAGGAYFFLDRSLGPIAGTVGGLGSWVALVFKSAFALIGMGAYLAFLIDIPLIPLAVGLTIVFGLINLIGAKETAGLQRILVAALVIILGYFLVDGFSSFMNRNPVNWSAPFGTPWFTDGLHGLLSTIGLVFVSYAGLTKVASVAEEVKDPSKNIPLGMILALVSTTVIYAAGVLLMVLLIRPEELFSDLTPVATAVSLTNNILPAWLALGLIVIAALSAFASTGNAGIMAASRYLLAMARDQLVTPLFSKISGRGTPYWSIGFTVVFMILILISIDIQQIAKLASAFQLLLFGLLNLAVVIMRESQIKTYDPGFKSPFYPWIQILGMLIPIWLIAEMGIEAVIFTGTLAVLAVLWYFFYAAGKVNRRGAIFHLHERLGRQKSEHIEEELRLIIKEQNLRSEDQYEQMISQSLVMDIRRQTEKPDYPQQVLQQASELWAERLPCTSDEVYQVLQDTNLDHWVPLAPHIVLAHWGVTFIDSPELLIIRCKEGLPIQQANGQAQDVQALFLMLFPESDHGTHLRMLGHLATFLDQEDFLDRWLGAQDDRTLRELLLRDEHYLTVEVSADHPLTNQWIHQQLMGLNLPKETLVTTIQRNSDWLIPHGHTELLEGDILTIIGQPSDIKQLRNLLN